MTKITWIEFDILKSFMKDVFVKIGITKEDAEIKALGASHITY